MTLTNLIHSFNTRYENDPHFAGVCAGKKVRFGPGGRYTVAPVHSRFDHVQWFVWDNTVDDDGLPATIRQRDTLAGALMSLAGLSDWSN